MIVMDHTFAIRWMMCSMIMDIKTKTKHTTATAQVGVSSNVLPPLAPAMITSCFGNNSQNFLDKNPLSELRLTIWILIWED